MFRDPYKFYWTELYEGGQRRSSTIGGPDGDRSRCLSDPYLGVGVLCRAFHLVVVRPLRRGKQVPDFLHFGLSLS